MGFKRPFGDEEFQELPFKQSRRFDHTNKLTQFADSVHCNEGHQKPIVSDEGEKGIRQSQCPEAFEKDSTAEIPNLAVRELENSAPVSWVTSSSGDEDAVSGATAYSSLSPEYFEHDFPQRTGVPFEDVYSSLLNNPPRKQVPLGPNHQADLPEWGVHMKKSKLEKKEAYNPNNSSVSVGSNHVIDDDNDVRLMGTCVIPMPDYMSLQNSDQAGDSRSGCSCLDDGSVRCVRQHVKEAREKLMKALGFENFVRLGLYDMGEEVAHKWTSAEEQLYHEVVYNNPARLGKNFWKHLSVVFPYRPRKEIVSYYFNVFMLWRRAAQNRSNFLDIDSDDDEWHGIGRGSYGVRVLEEDEDSDIESPVDQDDQVDDINDSLEGEYDDDDDDDDDDDNNSCNGDGDVGDLSADVIGEDYGASYTSEAYAVKSVDDGRFDPAVQHIDKFWGNGEEYNIEDDSCTSFEFQSNMVDSCSPTDSGAVLHESGVKSDQKKCLRGNFDGCDDLAAQVYLLDPCDAKDWDARYLIGSTKGVDFLPTCNIIEEIFGQNTPESKKRNE